MTVALLITARGRTIGVYADASEAEAKAAKFNADPFLEPGKADPDAPYRADVWNVHGADGSAS